MDFSLFYFANDSGTVEEDRHRLLLLDGTRFADEHGFHAVWTRNATSTRSAGRTRTRR